MRAITLANPIGHAMIYGGKRIENRKWAPLSLRSLETEVIAIHAGSRWYRDALGSARYPATAKLRADVERLCLERWVFGGADSRCSPTRLSDVPQRVILGAVRFVGAYQLERARQLYDAPGPGLEARRERYAWTRDPWALGPWCWLADRVWAFDTPLHHEIGCLGLWTPPPEANALLHALVATRGAP